MLGIIPARGGSKRLPGKNIAPTAGKPLISWTIDVALEAAFIDKVLLSTDDINIKQIGSSLGVDEVIVRPASLAQDTIPTSSVLLHALSVLEERGESFGYLVLLQPTSPLRTVEDVDKAFELMDKMNGIGVVSVCRSEHPKEWIGHISTDGYLETFIEQTELGKQSQELLPAYQVNGAIYIVPVSQFLEAKTVFLRGRMVAYVMDRKSSVDIDEEYDLLLAEWLLMQRDTVKN